MLRSREISNIDILLGLFIGLILSSHAIRSVIRIDFHQGIIAIFMLLIILSLLLKLNKFKNFKFDIIKSNFLVFIISSVLYFFLTAILNKNYLDFLELMSVLLPLCLMWLINEKPYIIKIAILVVLISCIVQSAYILYDRSYILNWKLNYLLIASLLPVTIIYCFSEIWFSKVALMKLFNILAVILMLMALGQVQARFSSVFALCGIVFVAILNFRKIASSKLGILILILVAFYVADIWLTIKRAAFYARMLELDINNIDRLEIIEIYLTLMSQHWLTGFGLGETPVIPKHFYPHNYLLEFYTEFGVIGFVFAVTITYLSVFRILKNFKNDSIDRFILILVLHYILFFLKSATIYDAYVLFICFGIALSRFSSYHDTGLTPRSEQISDAKS